MRLQTWIGQVHPSCPCSYQTETHPVRVHVTPIHISIRLFLTSFHSVGKQIVNVPSFVVRLDSQKHIDFSLTSPLGGGRPGRVKRKKMRAAEKGDDEEEEEDEE